MEQTGNRINNINRSASHRAPGKTAAAPPVTAHPVDLSDPHPRRLMVVVAAAVLRLVEEDLHPWKLARLDLRLETQQTCCEGKASQSIFLHEACIPCFVHAFMNEWLIYCYFYISQKASRKKGKLEKRLVKKGLVEKRLVEKSTFIKKRKGNHYKYSEAMCRIHRSLLSLF